VAEVHETPLRVGYVSPDGNVRVVAVQVVPERVSAKTLVPVPEEPTATQEVVEVHETPLSDAPVSADGNGRVAAVQVVPERVSTVGISYPVLLLKV